MIGDTTSSDSKYGRFGEYIDIRPQGLNPQESLQETALDLRTVYLLHRIFGTLIEAEIKALYNTMTISEYMSPTLSPSKDSRRTKYITANINIIIFKIDYLYRKMSSEAQEDVLDILSEWESNPKPVLCLIGEEFLFQNLFDRYCTYYCRGTLPEKWDVVKNYLIQTGVLTNSDSTKKFHYSGSDDGRFILAKKFREWLLPSGQ